MSEQKPTGRYKYRIKRMCEWQHRTWDPETDQRDGFVVFDVSEDADSIPPHHFEPIDGGPVGPTPEQHHAEKLATEDARRDAATAASDDPHRAKTLTDVGKTQKEKDQEKEIADLKARLTAAEGNPPELAEPTQDQVDTSKPVGGEITAAQAAEIDSRVTELVLDNTHEQLVEMSGPDGLDLKGAKTSMNKQQLATGIARDEFELEAFPEGGGDTNT